MIDPDTFILERSYQEQVNDYHFSDKQLSACPDTNNGSYPNGVVTFF